MLTPLKWTTAALLLSAFTTAHPPSPVTQPTVVQPVAAPQVATPKIQAAILLDVSNSMDGLIDQAKAQLWNMVSVMGKAKCNGVTPQIELALYEYGSPRNPAVKGFVKQLSAFTTDLDALSQTLFAITTNGGDEYCGQAIYTAVTDLAWGANAQDYKVIFIAGNEDFLQGSLQYTKACTAAKEKGILVNTIYCGSRQQGITEHWNLNAECGEGSFTNINQDAKEDDIATPYDSTLMVLNTRLNGTYVAYGINMMAGYNKQIQADSIGRVISKSSALKRVAVKGKQQLYKNTTWDMVDAADADSSFVAKVDMKTLPDSLKGKSRAQLQQLVTARKTERAGVQQQIGTLSVQREAYLAAERKKRAGANQQTLQTETEKMIRQQAKKHNMVVEE